MRELLNYIYNQGSLEMKIDHIKNGQNYAVYMDKARLYGGEGSQSPRSGGSPSPRMLMNGADQNNSD